MPRKNSPNVDLVRVDPSQNMARFYGIALQPNLFGEVSVIRCWGRIGTRGRSMVVTFQDNEQAAAVLDQLESQKRGGGYVDTTS